MEMLLDGLDALGRATVGSVWLPMAAWSLAAALALVILRRRPADAPAQYLARTALLWALPGGLVLAALTEFGPLDLWPAAPVPATPVPVVAAAPSAGVAVATPAAPAWDLTLYHGLGLLAVLAALLTVVEVGRMLGHGLALRRFVRRLRLRPAPPALQRRADALAAALGLWRPVRLRLAAEDVVPMAFGWRHPVVVVPDTLAADAENIRLVLLHEFVHIRRHDFLRLLTERLLVAVFAVNPLVRGVERSVRYFREAACDAEVLAAPAVSSRRYASLLLRFALPQAAWSPSLSMSAPQPDLKKRISAMRTAPPLVKKHVGYGLAFVLLGVAMLATACADLVGPNVKPANRAADGEPEVFVVVEEMPEIVGGLAGIQEKIRYPAEAREAGLEGRVIVQFVVDETGAVVDPVVVRGVGGSIDEEALRVLRLAEFRPGRQRGEPVKVKMSLPITFKLSGDAPSPRSTEGEGAQRTGVLSDRAGIFQVVEEMPRLAGGLDDVQRRLRYPPEAAVEGVEGTVVLRFVVDETGAVRDPAIVRGVGTRLDAEALRVLEGTRFTPGRQDGRPVKVAMSLPITFVLPEAARYRPAMPELEEAEEVLPREGPYVVVDEMPELIGGLDPLVEQLRMPAALKQDGVEGRVIVQFLVDKTGAVVDPVVVRGLSDAADAEALRVVRLARFKPGRLNGELVEVKMSLPITFSLPPEDGE